MNQQNTLVDELKDNISINGGIEFDFADGSEGQLRKFGSWGESQDAIRSPIVLVRCFNKQTIADLIAKMRRYHQAVGLGGVIVAVPSLKDEGQMTVRAYTSAQRDINDAFPDTPFLCVTHEQNSFADPQNLALAIALHEMQKHGIQSDIPLWSHSYAPELTDEQLDNVSSAMKIAPYLLSIRTQYETLELLPGILDSVQAIEQNLANLPRGFPASRIPHWKQLVRSTNGAVGVRAATSVAGGFSPLYGGEKFVVKNLPESVKPEGFDDCTIHDAAGEEDTDLWMRLSKDPAVRAVLRSVLGGPVVKYFDPDVDQKKNPQKFERAWSDDPHPAHFYMFPELASDPEHHAALAIQEKMNGKVPEDWRGVRFPSNA